MNKLSLKLKLNSKEMENKENNTKEVNKVTLRTEKEAKESNSLMRKTKAQLVEIIFRKDGLEKSLRSEIEQMKKSYNTDYINKVLNDSTANLKAYQKLKRDFEEICDKKVSIECAYVSIIKQYRKYVYILLSVGFISVVLNFILLCK